MDRSSRTTRDTYDRIAEHFASTREYAWPETGAFLDGRRGHRGLDLGCGNGRNAELLADHCECVVGLDISGALLAQARQRAVDHAFELELVQGDASRLPFGADRFDLVVYVATLHHLPTVADRRRSLDELARVLAPGGRALVSVWSTAHDRFDREEGFDTTVDWTLPGGESIPRFYHIYSPDEFDSDLAASALSVVESRVSSGNCYAVVEQKSP
ncbi:class I SAM-dependent methyltransferase [Haloarchaeobius sp. HRN-SO-5]|uniref:class I SAM-dependent methyltransferase n=1 Tax=Haloarchaeobius sp. HRN-SO-5 TaxID=3446118 RepID=UPI003EBA8892